jgi:hypothetical protein
MDVVGRVVAERMSVSLGQPIIIENVSGDPMGPMAPPALFARGVMATRLPSVA